MIKSRIAPTPSGFLHIGNVFSFLLTKSLVTQKNGILLLRIDDIDQTRFRSEYLEDIFDTLHFLQINYQEGPNNSAEFISHFSQHKRLNLYNQFLFQLRNCGLVFACVCSRTQLAATSFQCPCFSQKIPLDTPGASWRISTPKHTVIQFTDEKMGLISLDLEEQMPNFKIKKNDGLPSYQLCSLVDDIFFDINYIVRGQDLLASTAAQLYLAQLLGEEGFMQSTFHHHKLITDASGNKLSKSNDAISLHTKRKNGYSLQELLHDVQFHQHTQPNTHRNTE